MQRSDPKVSTVSADGLLPHTLPRPVGLIECPLVMDIGAGIRPMPWYRPERHICVEPHAPYGERLRDAGMEWVHATAAEALTTLKADAVYMLDVIEHMEEAEAREAVALAQQAARVQVVIYTPYGFKEQTTDPWGLGGETWQRHRSGWLPKDFPGWQTQLFRPKPSESPEGFYASWVPS
jgi:hypothetical protein